MPATALGPVAIHGRHARGNVQVARSNKGSTRWLDPVVRWQKRQWQSVTRSGGERTS
nr:hypothetical protein [Methylorubrum zatmanii]